MELQFPDCRLDIVGAEGSCCSIPCHRERLAKASGMLKALFARQAPAKIVQEASAYLGVYAIQVPVAAATMQYWVEQQYKPDIKPVQHEDCLEIFTLAAYLCAETELWVKRCLGSLDLDRKPSFGQVAAFLKIALASDLPTDTRIGLYQRLAGLVPGSVRASLPNVNCSTDDYWPAESSASGDKATLTYPKAKDLVYKEFTFYVGTAEDDMGSRRLGLVCEPIASANWQDRPSSDFPDMSSWLQYLCDRTSYLESSVGTHSAHVTLSIYSGVTPVRRLSRCVTLPASSKMDGFIRDPIWSRRIDDESYAYSFEVTKLEPLQAVPV